MAVSFLGLGEKRKCMHHKMFALPVVALFMPLLRAGLIADVMATPGPTVWSYTLFNNEPTGSPNFIDSFSLTVNAPITVTGTPAGWDFSTDDTTFVFWFNTDPALPYPHDVAPGSSLGGFSLTSTATSSQLLSYGLAGWDHSLDQPGPTTAGTVLVPSNVQQSVPEPPTWSLLGSTAVMILLRHRAGHLNPW